MKGGDIVAKRQQEPDLHIIRMSELGITQMIKNKKKGVYYCMTDTGKYQVTDNRSNKIDVKEFDTPEQVIEYFDKKGM